MAHGYRTEAMGKIMHVGHGNGEDAASWTVPHWKPGGGYVFNQVHNIQANVPPENILAMRETLRQAGRYGG